MAGQRSVEIPQSVLISAHSLDDLEDWLAAHDPEFLETVRRIRNDEDLAGEGKDLGEILRNFKKVLVPEINMGQLLQVLRARFLLPAIGFSKVQGLPFMASDIEQRIDELLESDT